MHANKNLNMVANTIISRYVRKCACKPCAHKAIQCKFHGNVCMRLNACLLP